MFHLSSISGPLDDRPHLLAHAVEVVGKIDLAPRQAGHVDGPGHPVPGDHEHAAARLQARPLQELVGMRIRPLAVVGLAAACP